jgi:putative transposase
MSQRLNRTRYEIPGHARLLTFSCQHRLPLFTNDTIKDAFTDRLADAMDRHRFRLSAWVVMPEHVHLLPLPDHDTAGVPTILKSMKSGFAKAVIARWRRMCPPPPILDRLTHNGQTRFWLKGGGHDRNVYSQHELFEKIHYLHQNPVRRGLVEHADDWRWSSLWWTRHHPGHPLATDLLR